jgi:hypothetical protein
MRGFILGFALCLTLALGVAVAEGPSGTPSPTPTEHSLWNLAVIRVGDANCDGQITPADALLILRFVDDLESPHVPCPVGAAVAIAH